MAFRAATSQDIARAMIRYGGSFVEALGRALQHADSENEAIIQASWPKYWNQYRKFAEADQNGA